ncbi:MAG: heavy metal translocating P-type ATPase, partial [Butyricicoccaceae bacterium]
AESLSDYSSDAVYAYAAAAEQLSEHPLGKAVVQCYQKDTQAEILPSEDFRMLPGAGVTAVVDGKPVRAGSLKLLDGVAQTAEAEQKAAKYLSDGCTVTYVAIGDTLAGYLVLSDTVRGESADTIRAIHTLGIQPVLLTGDNRNAAEAIGRQLGITEIRANCLPEDKLDQIGAYQKQGIGVCMIGDGVNDAPALKKADVGIAMGGVGSDIAVDAADIALVDDEIKELPHLLALSKRMMHTIKLNLTFSMSLNFLAIILAITGLLGPVVGALVHNAGSVLVIINSALLLTWRKH